MSHESITIKISLDAPLFKEQRKFLNMIITSALDTGAIEEEVVDKLIGIQNLLDSIADVAHDKYGLDTLLEEEENDQK